MIVTRIIAATVLAASSLSVASCAQEISSAIVSENAVDVLTIKSERGDHKFNIEFADTDEERRLGLMHRTELAADAGMLFDFETEKPVSMWMKNTLISLDMAFIDQNGVIKRIAANTTPRSLASIKSGAPVLAVLEVNGGAFERLGIKEGDRVIHPLFDDKSQ